MALAALPRDLPAAPSPKAPRRHVQLLTYARAGKRSHLAALHLAALRLARRHAKDSPTFCQPQTPQTSADAADGQIPPNPTYITMVPSGSLVFPCFVTDACNSSGEETSPCFFCLYLGPAHYLTPSMQWNYHSRRCEAAVGSLRHVSRQRRTPPYFRMHNRV